MVVKLQKIYQALHYAFWRKNLSFIVRTFSEGPKKAENSNFFENRVSWSILNSEQTQFEVDFSKVNFTFMLGKSIKMTTEKPKSPKF